MSPEDTTGACGEGPFLVGAMPDPEIEDVDGRCVVARRLVLLWRPPGGWRNYPPTQSGRGWVPAYDLADFRAEQQFRLAASWIGLTNGRAIWIGPFAMRRGAVEALCAASTIPGLLAGLVASKECPQMDAPSPAQWILLQKWRRAWQERERKAAEGAVDMRGIGDRPNAWRR